MSRRESVQGPASAPSCRLACWSSGFPFVAKLRRELFKELIATLRAGLRPSARPPLPRLRPIASSSRRRFARGIGPVTGALAALLLLSVPATAYSATHSLPERGEIPQFDLVRTCRGVSQDIGGTPDTCLGDENDARAQLAKRWSNFPPADRERCGELAGMPGFQSYVELLTCLEIGAQVKALRK